MEALFSKIKNQLLFLAIVVWLVSIFGCLTEEPQPLPFFNIEIKPYDIRKEKFGMVVLNGELREKGLENLDDHGFIWSLSEKELFDNPESVPDKISLGTRDLDGTFTDSFFIETIDAEYYFRAFGKMGERIVFSEKTEKFHSAPRSLF